MLYEARTLKSLFARDIVMWEKSEMSSSLQFPWGGGVKAQVELRGW